MTDLIVIAFVLLALRALYKTFIEPGWKMSQTRKDFERWRNG